MTATTTRLTVADRRHIAQARALVPAASAAAICEGLTALGLIEPGELDDRDPFAFAFGVARSLLEDLADLAERLGG